MSTENLNTVKSFLAALSNGKYGEDLRDYYHPDIIQTEYPNLLTKEKTDRDLGKLLEASRSGIKVLLSQRYELVNAYEFENVVIIEAIWIANIAVPIGKIPAGGEMSAHFAQFFEFKDGKIIRQRNYDCFTNFM